MKKVIDITGRQAEKEKSYAHSAFNEFWADIVGELGGILLKEVNCDKILQNRVILKII